jgi:NAD(P)-dependent dehydrogenase (short-subunit alcohol dehydrogenase family)
VTGSSRGIGASIAVKAAAEGATVAVHYFRSPDGAATTLARVRAAGGDGDVFDANVADGAEAEGLVARVIERFGRVDGLVNNAGLTQVSPFLTITPDVWDAVIRTDLTASFHTCRAALPSMLERGTGSIVNIASRLGQMGIAETAAYSAAKAGLIGLTRNAAYAHRWDRIRINGINIGWTETEGEDHIQRAYHGGQDDWLDMAAKSVPMGKLGQVDEIAEFVVLLLSDRSGVVTGSIIDWDQTVIGAYD